MALTLLEAAKLHSGNVLRAGVIETFASRSPILAALPFDTIAGGSVTYNREGALPGVAFRGIGESYTESTGIINPLTEQAVICGGDVDVDLALLAMHGEDQMSVQVGMKLKALADLWQQKLFKGDASSNPREFDGLQTRIPIGVGQAVSNGSTSGGDPLSLIKLDQAIDLVDEPTHILMSKAMRRRFAAAARTTTVGGYVTFETTSLGMRVTRYNDLPILVTESGSTEPLGFSEAGTGGGSTATSIYIVSFREGYLTGFQVSDPDIRDLGEHPDNPVNRQRIEWMAGLQMPHPRAAARLHSISDAAIVA